MSNFLAFISIFLILGFAFLKKQLTIPAVITAFFVGIILYVCGGWMFLSALYLFFISSVIASNVKKKYKLKVLKEVHSDDKRRNYKQVLANSLVAVVMAILFYFTDNVVYMVAVIICFACYNADTWASEFGVFSKKRPRFIIGLQPSDRGISGAITMFGLLMSFIGSMLIGLIYIPFSISNGYFDTIYMVFLISYLGFLSAIFDSVLGQFFQVLYYNKKLDKYTEKKKSGDVLNKKVKGFHFMTNDMVNFISPLLVVLLYLFFC